MTRQQGRQYDHVNLHTLYLSERPNTGISPGNVDDAKRHRSMLCTCEELQILHFPWKCGAVLGRDIRLQSLPEKLM
jgi:hypothetical protein